jgi:uncharacterized protein
MLSARATSPLAPEARIEALDALRGIALFGVLIVNLVTEFRISIFQQFLHQGSPGVDGVVERVVLFAFEEKAFCLFALLFGIGLAMQFDRLSHTGRPLYWLSRRLAVLLALGLIHLFLVWNGDILTEYALAGFLVLPLLRLRPALLLFASFALLTVHVVGPAFYSIPWPSAAELRAHVASANQVYATGSLPEIWRFSLTELPLFLSLHAFVFPRTLALFVFGVFLWRIGVVRRAEQVIEETFLVAMAGILAGAALTASGRYGGVAPVVLALGYAAALWTLAQLALTRRLLRTFAPIGRMAFSNYVLQSVLLGFVFFGWGLGQFGRMGATAGLALGVGIYVAQVLFSRWWLRRYRFGPLEWLWRTLMYGRHQPMQKALAATS